MLSRRDFLRGLLSSVAAAALVKNGVVQPKQVIGVDCAEGKDRSVATVFDMAANTWREQLQFKKFGPSIYISDELLADCVFGNIAGVPSQRCTTIIGTFDEITVYEGVIPITLPAPPYSIAVYDNLPDFRKAIMHRVVDAPEPALNKRFFDIITWTERVETYRQALGDWYDLP